MIEHYGMLAAAIVAGIAIGMAIEQIRRDLARKAWRARNRRRWNTDYRKTLAETGAAAAHPVLDAPEQLRIVMSADYQVQPLLNRSEARLFRELDQMVLGRKPGWQVMAQVSLGEILRTPDSRAYACINSKRVDLLLVDENCHPRHAIEYQGSGHHRGTAAARDAVKKEALRRAGISYHEVVGGETTRSDLRRLIEKLLPDPREAPAPERVAKLHVV